MDQKHREYCIRLGNPYMKEEQFNKQFKNAEEINSSWMSETEMKVQNVEWLNNKNNNF